MVGSSDSATRAKTAFSPELRAWFEEVYAKHHALVIGFLRARLLNPDDAEDLTQEVFLRCYEKRDQFDPTRASGASAWLRGIGRNVLREHIRRFGRRKEVQWTELCLELDGLVGEDPAEDDRLSVLPTCLGKLGDSAAEAIQAHYMSGRKLSDIAGQMNRTVGAVKVLLVRARQALRRCIEMQLDRQK